MKVAASEAMPPFVLVWAALAGTGISDHGLAWFPLTAAVSALLAAPMAILAVQASRWCQED